MAAEQQLGIDHLITILKKESCTCSVGYNKTKLYEMDSWEYLAFAQDDLLEDTERGRINALSNAKRAIDCRADELIALLNFRYFSHKQRWGLPYKLQVLKTLGVSAPDVLVSFITSKRNILEHEYVRPREAQEIKYVADIVELFLKANDRYIENGHMASATIMHPKELQSENTTRKKKVLVFEEAQYQVKFGLEDNSVSVTYIERYVTQEISIGSLREKPTMKSKYEASFSISHCRQEDFRDLINLILKKSS